MAKEILKPCYLGDGVYAHHTGHSITLAVNHHLNKVVVLEDEVLESLIEYARAANLIKK